MSFCHRISVVNFTCPVNMDYLLIIVSSGWLRLLWLTSCAASTGPCYRGNPVASGLKVTMVASTWRKEERNLSFVPHDIARVKALIRADYFMACAVALALSLSVDNYGAVKPLFTSDSTLDITLPWETEEAMDDLGALVASLRQKKHECLMAKLSVRDLEAELLIDGLILLSLM